MDSEDSLPEKGTPLPLPENIDCHVGALEGPHQGSLDPPDRGDVENFDHSHPGSPPCDTETGGSDAAGGEEGLFGPGGCSPFEGGSVDHEEHGGEEDEMTDADRARLDSVIHQAMLGANLADGLSLPWETGIMATIFGDAPIVQEVTLPKIAHTLDHSEVEPLNRPGSLENQAKRQRKEVCTNRLYERAISFKNTLTDPEMDQAKWGRALEKLYTVMVSGPSSCPKGISFIAGDVEKNLRQIRLLCGARSPNTIAKRAHSLLQFCLWHRGFYYKKHPIPFTQDEVADYVWEKHQDGMTYTGLTSFVEAVHFGTHVLGLPVTNPETPLVSAFVKGVLDKMALSRPKRKQARPLTVPEVTFLENMVKDQAVDPFDRYAAGAFLFALFGRCRWSDLKDVSHFFLDVSTIDSRTIGYIEFATFSHKTAAQVARHGLPLPLVAPIWGLTNPCWALVWHKLSKEVDLCFNESFKGPILPAPDKTGSWNRRSVSASEATKWLGELLKQGGFNLEAVTSHSLKCTVLSWLAKAGTEPHHRLVLGHHSTQKGSLETYSRDMLAAPLRAMEDVLRRIRVGALRPDMTRSGHIQEPTRPDCAADQPDQNNSDSSSSSGKSSSSSSSSETDSDSEAAGNLLTVGGTDPDVQQSSWGLGIMYQHELSKIVHLKLNEENSTFVCGVNARKDHAVVESTSFLEYRKCKRCTRVLDSA